MSENLRKLKIGEGKQQQRIQRKGWNQDRETFYRYKELGGMANIEDLERRAAEARKEEGILKQEEKQLEEKVKRMATSSVRIIIADIIDMLRDEEEGIRKYTTIKEKYEIGITTEFARRSWRGIFDTILNDEKKHKAMLITVINSVYEEWIKYGPWKPNEVKEMEDLRKKANIIY